MLKIKTDRQITLIVNNIVVACKDITKLNKTGYDFIYLASGFIAHYNLHGFIAHYQEHNLSADIVRNLKGNRYLNFRPGDENYDYYHQKADIYLAIADKLGEKMIKAFELEEAFTPSQMEIDNEELSKIKL
jgi:hypothetical protein